MSSTETSATATPSWILGSNGGILASVQIADKNSLILSGGILTLSGTNTYTGKTVIAAGKLNISYPIVSTPYSFVIDSGATLDISGNSGTNLSIIDLSGSGNMELGNQLLTITNAANSTFSGVISNPSSYNLSDIVINNNIATINFAEPCGNIAVGEIVAVANSSVSTLNNDYRIVSFSENSATATYYYNWVPTSLGGSINKIDDVMIIPEYNLSGITIQDNIASINFAPDAAGYYDYTPIDVGKIVTVVNSSVSIFNNTYTVISSTYYNAIATPNWVLKSNGGSLDLESNYSLYLSGGTLTLSGINTYSGGTRVDNSKLILTNSKSLGLGDAGLLCIDGNLLFTDTFTISKFLLTNSATNLGTQLSVVTDKTVTFAAGVGGRYPLIIGDDTNKGSVEFSNEYRGPLTVYKDVSVNFNVSVILNKPVIIDTGSILMLAANSEITDSVEGGGDITVKGDVTVSGIPKPDYTGEFNVESGTLNMNSSTNASQYNLAADATVNFSVVDNIVAGNIVGSGITNFLANTNLNSDDNTGYDGKFNVGTDVVEVVLTASSDSLGKSTVSIPGGNQVIIPVSESASESNIAAKVTFTKVLGKIAGKLAVKKVS
jgi:autotransporter-associated beta strand protein